MATRRLESVLGDPATAAQPNQRAEHILDSLKYGHNLGFACGLPQPCATSWGRVRVLEQPSGSDDPPPFERLASALAGLETTLEVSIAAETGGLSLSLGFTTAGELARARRLLAPGCLIEPSPSPTVVGPHVVGVTHRPQSVVGDASAPPATVASLFDKLEGVDGDWTLFLHCEGAPMTEVLGTVRKLGALAEEAAANLNVTRQMTDTLTSTAISHRWNRVREWIGVVSTLLSQGAGVGLWTVDMWAVAQDSATARMLAGALHASIPSDQGRWYETLNYVDTTPGDPPPTSVLTSRDLGRLLVPPRTSKPGLAVRHAPPAGRRPSTSSDVLRLGKYLGTDVTSAIAVEDLEGHAFVTGTTGSGKSTTVHRLLAELWNRHRIPFLVLDPVKDDYSAAARHFDGGIQLVRGADLHLNLLEAWPGEDLRGHISQVASAFKGAFSMPSPTPYVVTQLFDRVAMLPSRGAGMSLFDVRDMVSPLIASLGYAPEQESNIRAALMTRLNLLLAPSRAHRFSWTDSSMVQELFERPSVVTLGDLSDDEERSFVVLLLALATSARARARTNPRPVDHVLVLEEAHRILPEIDDRQADPEVGSARQVSAGMLSAMMAEVRSYGEQIIVIDQSPARVSSEVSRNTNLKLAHRVVHPEDQAQVAGMLGLPAGETALVGELGRGDALYTTRTEPSVQAVAIAALLPEENPVAGAVRHVKPPASTWLCGNHNIEAHYRAWQLGPKAAAPMSLFLAGVLWGDGNGRKLREQVYRELLTVSDGNQALTDCLAWAGLRQLTARRRMAGPGSGPYGADAQFASLYQVWAGRLPVNKDAVDGFGVPPVNGALPAEIHLTWEQQSIADTLLGAEPRNGLRALKTGAWRAELPELSGYLKRRQAWLEPLLGDGATILLRVLVRAAAASANLTADVAEQLITRAGLGQNTA